MWQSPQSLIFNHVLFLTLVICDNKCYSCVIFPLYVWERIQQEVYPPAGTKQGQRDPSGHQQRTETSPRQRRHLPRNTPLSKSGSQGLALSIFVLSGFWQLRWEARGLSYPAWDINKPLMTGNSPRYTVRHRPLPNRLQFFQLCHTQHTHWPRDDHGVVLQECFTLLIRVRSSYKGRCINKDIYQNADSEQTEIGTWQW